GAFSHTARRRKFLEWFHDGGPDGLWLSSVHDYRFAANETAKRANARQVFHSSQKVRNPSYGSRMMMDLANKPKSQELAQEELDAHVREIVRWHFSPATGCSFWLDWAKRASLDPGKEITSFA